jgi:hypothetical protein
MDRTTEVHGDAKPIEGDLSMCIACGAVAVFNADLTLRKPNKDDLIRSNDPLLVQAQIIRAGMIGDKLKGRK